MTRSTFRFVLLIASAAVAPLLVYGVVSFYSLKTATEQSVREGNLRVADQVKLEFERSAIGRIVEGQGDKDA